MVTLAIAKAGTICDRLNIRLGLNREAWTALAARPIGERLNGERAHRALHGQTRAPGSGSGGGARRLPGANPGNTMEPDMKRLHPYRRRAAAIPVVGLAVACAAFTMTVSLDSPASADPLAGITVGPEYRCAPYRRADYRYPQSIEARIVAAQDGHVYGPYTGRTFASTGQTDIEHIVSLSEAHDSGLCAAGPATRRRFATDLRNLTLAAPAVNRCARGAKCGHDAAGWLPPMNRCWFAARVVAVKREYGLTVDRREAVALKGVLAHCDTTEMIGPGAAGTRRASDPVSGRPDPSPIAPSTGTDALRRWDDNANGRITCKEARRHGIAPVPRGHPAYPFMHDADRDGVVCE